MTPSKEAIEAAKACSKCLRNLPFSQFYSRPDRPSAKSWCKDCCKLDSKSRRKPQTKADALRKAKWYRQNVTEIRDKQKSHTNKYDRASYLRNKDKYRARDLLKKAVLKGIIVKPKVCESCKTEDIPLHGHHDDYNKPLEVRWLCSYCHGITHTIYLEAV